MKKIYLLTFLFFLQCNGMNSNQEMVSIALAGIAAGTNADSGNNTGNVATICSQTKTSNTWNIVRDKNNDPLSDPQDNGSTSRDIVGNSTYPAFYNYYDGTDIYFRMRISASPLQTISNFSPFSWGLLIDSNQNDTHYEWMVLLDGITNPDRLRIGQKTSTNNPGDYTVAADTFYAITGTMSTNPVSPSIGANDHLIDIKISKSEFTQITGINENTPIRYFIGSGSSTNSINADTTAASYTGNFSSFVNINGVKCD